LQEHKNYITPFGFKRLQQEYEYLKYKQRPEIVNVVHWAAGNGDRSENGDYLYGKKKLREIDRRLGFLAKQIENAEVIDPSSKNSKKIEFGASVTILDESDTEKTYSIVGVDEVDVEKGRISWRSPLGAALISKSEGDIVEYKSPQGLKEIEIITVVYIEVVIDDFNENKN
jgi:transcription elongation factor GreB